MDDLDYVRVARDIIAERLEQVFVERGKRLTHRDIAAECGISQNVISLYIRGFIVNGNFILVGKFLRWVGINPTEFYEKLGVYK